MANIMDMWMTFTQWVPTMFSVDVNIQMKYAIIRSELGICFEWLLDGWGFTKRRLLHDLNWIYRKFSQLN